MSEYILIPELVLDKNFNNKIFINKTSKELNLKFFKKGDLTIKYLGASRSERLKEVKYVENISKKIIQILSNALNDIHKEEYSSRYWEIILRPWLYVFIFAIKNRYRKINFILNKKKNIKFLGNFIFDKSLTPSDTKNFNLIHCTEDWNNFIYFEIFKHLSQNNIFKKKYYIKKKNISKQIINKKSLKNYIDTLIEKIDFGFNKIFIHNSGMNFFNELFLNLILFQVPRFYFEKKFIKLNYNSNLRFILDNKIKNIYKKSNDSFLNFLVKIIPNQIPLMALEGFKKYKISSLNQKFPKDPYVIFTSNSFNTDEMFKFYTANCLEKKSLTKYIIGQHGNSYNTNIMNEYLPELLTCDYFINWGIKKQKQISFCNFISKKEEYVSSNKKHLLIILRSIGEKRTLFDQELENEKCEKNVINFLKNLKVKNIDNILLKPHFSHNLDSLFFREIRYKFPHVKILDKNIKISKLFKFCKLVVFNYDATTYLHLLSSNFPTLAFWPDNDTHVVNEMRPLYKILKKNLLWSSNPLQISNLINKNWSNLDKWWFNNNRQKAIKFIYKNLSKPRKNLFLFDLKKILTSFR